MTNISTSEIIKEHLNSADEIVAYYLNKIDSIYENSDIDDANVVKQLKQLMNTIVDDVRLDNLSRIREWMITYIYTLCEDITS